MLKQTIQWPKVIHLKTDNTVAKSDILKQTIQWPKVIHLKTDNTVAKKNDNKTNNDPQYTKQKIILLIV